jgi:sarcosine oxidase
MNHGADSFCKTNASRRPEFIKSESEPNLHAETHCYYTTTPDGGFIVDRHPDHDRLLVLSACSGHGFKHSLGVGELAAQMLLGKGTTCDAASFSVDRFCA